MKFNNMAVLREELERMQTPQLDDLLLEELRRDVPDGDLVRLIGSILRERDRNAAPQIDGDVQAAWTRYQEKSRRIRKQARGIALKAASLILVVFVTMALLPREAQAENFFERFIAWTGDVFSLSSPAEDGDGDGTYVFQTDNPGLQEVYEQVTALGVTVPVVPMWLPEGYELKECSLTNTPTQEYITATFLNGNTSMVYQLMLYSDNISSEYYKGSSELEEYEFNDVTHRIIHNKDFMVAVWSIENVECSISLDCREDVLYRILESIYTVEEN